MINYLVSPHTDIYVTLNFDINESFLFFSQKTQKKSPEMDHKDNCASLWTRSLVCFRMKMELIEAGTRVELTGKCKEIKLTLWWRKVKGMLVSTGKGGKLPQ